MHHKNFEWLSGFELTKTYKKETGFTANFCTLCGSTLPNQVPSLALMWIPLGALDNEITPKNRS
ncbi:GFA family protein [Acinetobacter equi]|uniref:GFA family protein n=1 Tax=Acinetobacter equi TaxID=1324350 RepID=UPI001D0D3B53|nr:GFA family protein [Acinetobacter equi]